MRLQLLHLRSAWQPWQSSIPRERMYCTIYPQAEHQGSLPSSSATLSWLSAGVGCVGLTETRIPSHLGPKTTASLRLYYGSKLHWT
ncbi:hypothetical protein CC78DRAFT_528969 [Lojkania enalia]|uniref:Uncharacterized protein n=1 Tax=Lojkania enalia TaxID=147567 RepID=A0A9P4NAT7_9PLEO|nr:hypothetical protein CC78DRAFT_528969 [Didymosphaeria enalia]